ncbi:aminotransferase class III-fold pyridoxal phosphate-dependent enzyme [Nocardia sp. BMG51109]|uniref:aminotransferase class III-fold pyridoxal phosphate-dependent enzyme n=1 Tax=Nocardia sp. BMG51109 TaxID=1056816 RepID=UPI0004650BE3|nr:aminotransferase class III-fold pyridoxal phosphate-dependent enzyme [Nocardia sp. BMG51109]
MKFGFLVHPVSAQQQNMIRAATLLAATVAGRAGRGPAAPYLPVPSFGHIVSPTGASCSGEVRYIPHTAPDLLGHVSESVSYVIDQVRSLHDNGAALVGLGGATSIIGNRGQRIADQVDIPVTSGNSLTAHAAHRLLHEVLDTLGEDIGTVPIGVIGAPGSIATALASLLLEDGAEVVLACRKGRVDPLLVLAEFPQRHRDRVEVTTDLADCLAKTTVVLAASSSGAIVEETALRPGTVVIDVALPRDVVHAERPREDVLILDGGLMTAGSALGSGFGLSEQLNGCLAETIVLALEQRPESYSLGRQLDPARIGEIGELAARHGFRVARPARLGRPLPDGRLAGFAAVRGRARTGGADESTLARRRFATHVNPQVGSMYAVHGLDRVFTTGHGAVLATADGTEYLDFVAGYGCLNVGHNHPAVTRAARGFLTGGQPTFVQYTSVPARTGELAERLCHLAPGTMERVFFSNSGTEAVEAALKMARAATGRTRIVYADNSFHGKTLGALSVTGRESHRAQFHPLVPDCLRVPYGDEDELRAAVAGAAAFIVEPVQGEGGVVVAPPGYLAAAANICREAGALLIVDEIQTGLGRTGTMFACESQLVEPDILCLAKSLSGGLVPIGATLTTAAVWDAAYASPTRSIAHTSTFGGGNFAAAVALATLDVLVGEELSTRADRLGKRLRAGLERVCAPFDFIAETRGVGLMNAIAFDPGYFAGATGAAVSESLTRLPGGLFDLSDTLPDTVSESLRHAGTAVEQALTELLCMRFVSALGTRHRILTFITANTNQVMRIQPPLVVDEADIDRFVEATGEVCGTLQHRLGH